MRQTKWGPIVKALFHGFICYLLVGLIQILMSVAFVVSWCLSDAYLSSLLFNFTRLLNPREVFWLDFPVSLSNFRIIPGKKLKARTWEVLSRDAAYDFSFLVTLCYWPEFETLCQREPTQLFPLPLSQWKTALSLLRMLQEFPNN